MKIRPLQALAAWGLVAGLLTTGCTSATAPLPGSDASTDSIELTVSVAASVQDAMKEVQAAYQATDPGVTLTYNFGASGALAQQIAQGAPADVYLSASQRWMDDLAAKGEIRPATRQDLLQNAMVLVVPREQKTIAGFKDLETEAIAKIAIGEPESVPAGRYAREVLSALNLFETLQPRLVFGKDVRQVLTYVETGNVAAGLVYATDAQISDRVRVVATAPPDTHAPIVYPIAIVQDSPQPEAAQAFIEFLRTETAMAIFESYGFTPAES